MTTNHLAFDTASEDTFNVPDAYNEVPLTFTQNYSDYNIIPE